MADVDDHPEIAAVAGGLDRCLGLGLCGGGRLAARSCGAVLAGTVPVGSPATGATCVTNRASVSSESVRARGRVVKPANGMDIPTTESPRPRRPRLGTEEWT